MQPLLDSEDLAKALKIDSDAVISLVDQGRLRAYRIEAELRFREEDVTQFLESCLVGSGADVPPTTGAAKPEVHEINADGDTRKQCKTFGGQATFPYTGSVETGTAIWPGKRAHFQLQFDAQKWRALLEEFRGREVRSGLNFARPEPDSMGAWIKKHWNTKMGPAAYVGGILIAEGYAERPRRGRIRFFEKRKSAACQ